MNRRRFLLTTSAASLSPAAMLGVAAAEPPLRIDPRWRMRKRWPGPIRGLQVAIPNLAVTQLTQHGKAVSYHPFNVSSPGGYLYVRISFTVYNAGTAPAKTFVIEPRYKSIRSTAQRAGFVQESFLLVHGSKTGPGQVQISGPAPAPGGPLPFLLTMPAGWILECTATVAVKARLASRMALWVVADGTDRVRESNETDNASSAIFVK